LAVSAGGLWLAFHKQPLGNLWKTLRGANLTVFLAGFAVYGLTLVCASARWHLFLRMTGCASHFGATARATLVGHFFFSFFLGAAGADTARTTLYARWFRQPLPRVLLAVTLERIITLAGWAAPVSLGLILAVQKNLLPVDKLVAQVRVSWLIAAGITGLAGAALAIYYIRRASNIIGRAGRPLLDGVRQLISRPRVSVGGWALSVGVQLVLIVVSIINLQAVSAQAIPWFRIIWVFPVVMFLSALPISAAGLGVRESASIYMLALYHIPAENAGAASLLTFFGTVLWAVPGGIILWRQERERKKTARPVPESISVVIPTLNEAVELPGTLERLRRAPQFREIIVVDAASSDGTRAVAERFGCVTLDAPAGRGGQMRRGAERATGDVILFLHADSWAPPEAGEAILAAFRDSSVVGGGFWKVFRERRLLLLGSRFKCASRLYFGGLILGDQGFFVRRDALAEAGGVPDLPLMEEFELCRRLRKTGRLALADSTITTSARRFVKNGILLTYARMWRRALAFQLGRKSAEELKAGYNRD
jgi:rSAM/selenodomain-associated transferase 2